MGSEAAHIGGQPKYLVKYGDVIATLPRLLTARDAEDYVATPPMLGELRDAWGLAPIEQRRGMTIYDRHDIDASIERMKLAAREN